MATTVLLIQYLLTLLFLRTASAAPVQIVLDHYDDKGLNKILTVSLRRSFQTPPIYLCIPVPCALSLNNQPNS
jgi:hypothetical protein